jgi:hypothetical protein
MHDSEDKPEEEHELEEHELDADAEPLPDRELMSLIDTNVVIPVNAAVAANVLSDDSLAAANAEQDVDIEQSNDEEGGATNG